MLILLTGCDSKYELTIDKDSIKENVSFRLSDDDYENGNFLSEVFSLDFRYFYNEQLNFESEKESGKFYIDYIKNNDLYPSYRIGDVYEKDVVGERIKLRYTYRGDDYLGSQLFYYCFGDHYFDFTDDYYVIKGYNSFKCLLNDDTKIVIKTDNRVINHNADKVIGNRYIWYFTPKNNLDHTLYIQVSKKYKQPKHFDFSVGLFVILVLGIVGYVIYSRRKMKRVSDV